MHRSILAIPLVLASCSATPETEPVRPADPARDRIELVQKIEDFHRSIREGDKEGYAGVFTDDFVFTWSRERTDLRQGVDPPERRPDAGLPAAHGRTPVRIHGDAAVLNFRVRKSEEEPGARVTFSCGRIDGVWKVLASHSTPIVEDEDEDEDRGVTRSIARTARGD